MITKVEPGDGNRIRVGKDHAFKLGTDLVTEWQMAPSVDRINRSFGNSPDATGGVRRAF